MKLGYAFEREIELFACRCLGQDPRKEFSHRSYRTATSGTHGDGDVKIRHHEMPFLLLVECKHRKYFYGGDFAFRLDRIVLEHICDEAQGSKEPQHEFSVPAVCFAFKRATKNRVWFVIPQSSYWRMLRAAGKPIPVLADLSLLHKKGEKQDYIIIRRSDVEILLVGGAFQFPIVEGIPDRGRLCIVPMSEVESVLKHYCAN